MLENNYFNLFLGVPDTDLAKLIESCQKTGGFDDFNYAVFDSTSVEVSSCWPTDAGVI